LSSCLLLIKTGIHKTIILPVVLCGCATWTFTLREYNRLRVLENMVMRMIFGLYKGGVKGGLKEIA
jgi:hypothetical protein